MKYKILCVLNSVSSNTVLQALNSYKEWLLSKLGIEVVWDIVITDELQEPLKIISYGQWKGIDFSMLDKYMDREGNQAVVYFFNGLGQTGLANFTTQGARAKISIVCANLSIDQIKHQIEHEMIHGFFANLRIKGTDLPDGLDSHTDISGEDIELAKIKPHINLLTGVLPIDKPREVFLPLKDRKVITQNFGENPAWYEQFGLNGHNGIDFRTRFWDTPLGRRYVYATMDGVVIAVGDQGRQGYGKFIRLNHKGTEQTVYAHLTKPYVSLWQTVRAGQLIGLTGNTGFTTGPHLHFGYRADNFDVNNGFAGYSDPKVAIFKELLL